MGDESPEGSSLRIRTFKANACSVERRGALDVDDVEVAVQDLCDAQSAATVRHRMRQSWVVMIRSRLSSDCSSMCTGTTGKVTTSRTSAGTPLQSQ